MYIFFYLSILVLAIGIVFFTIGIKKERQDLIKLEDSKRDYLNKQLSTLYQKYDKLDQERQQLEIKRDAIKREQEIEQQRLQDLKSHSYELLTTERERVNTEVKMIRHQKMEELRKEYDQQRVILEHNFLQRRDDINEQLEACQNELKAFQDIQASINEAARRKREIEKQESFYSIDVSENDQEDIAILQSMDARLHHRDAIPKLIWELFIRRPAQEMIKRVVGPEKSSGIYKITYKNTGEAYIGKTTDFATRWTNHIKTAIGLEAAAKSTLHTRMAKDGIWNYTFEILERVDKEYLAQRESYYIDLYGTKNQLNMKSGERNGTQ